jgi:hypothetical protein
MRRWSYRDRQRLAAPLRWDGERRPRPMVSLPYVRLEPELKPAVLRTSRELQVRLCASSTRAIGM